MKTTVVNFSYFEISIGMGTLIRILFNREWMLFFWSLVHTCKPSNQMRVCVDGTANMRCAICEQFAYYLPRIVCWFFAQTQKGLSVLGVLCLSQVHWKLIDLAPSANYLVCTCAPALMLARLILNRDSLKKMTNHEASQISLYTLRTNLIEFWICDSQKNSDGLQIFFSLSSTPVDYFPQFLFSLLIYLSSTWGVS